MADEKTDQKKTRSYNIDFLEHEITGMLKDYSISEEERDFIWKASRIIMEKDPETWMHCARVARKCVTVVRYLKKADQEGLLFPPIENEKDVLDPAIVHDLGKAGVEDEVLHKKSGFNEEDRKKMSRHIPLGYEYLVAHKHWFTAEVVRLHHSIKDCSVSIEPHLFDSGRYKAVPNPNRRNSDKSYGERYSDTVRCAALVSMADFHDAMMTRENDWMEPGNPRVPTPEEGRGKIISYHNEHAPSMVPLIARCYDVGIFGRAI